MEIFANKPKGSEPWDVAIIGSGPAGLTSAIYTTRGAASTIIFAGDTWGGQLMLTTDVDNYPALPGIQGPDLMQKMKDHSMRFGAEMIQKNVERVDFTGSPFKLTADGVVYYAKSVIIATGSKTKWLEVEGEDKLRGRGVSSCAPCDAPFFKGKKVVVVGGGDSAMEEALVLSKYASQVVLVHRRDEFRASAAMQKRVFDTGNDLIDIVWGTKVSRLVGDTKLEKVEFITETTSKHFSELKNKIITHKGEIASEDRQLIWSMPADGLFVAIGHTPSTKIFEGSGINLDDKGYVIKVNKEGFAMATSRDGVFVAGDVHDYHYMQAITAAGFGCQAAMDTLKYLEDRK